MLAVLAELLGQGHRYQDLYDALDGICYKVLTETLRRAEREGLMPGPAADSQCPPETTGTHHEPARPPSHESRASTRPSN